MKEVIFVILEGFADWEGAYIATCLNQGVKPGNPISYKVKTLSITKEPVSSIGGFKVLPDYGLNDMPENYAGLVLIGGMNWFSPLGELIVPLVGDKYTGDSNYINKQAVRDGNIVTANGTGQLEFCKEILYALEADTTDAIEESYLFYKNGFCPET